MFSPYYAWDRSRDPYDHCALNVVLYGERGGRFAMTERGRTRLERTAHKLTIGPSTLDWDGSTLTIGIDERAAPVPHALRGLVRVRPKGLTGAPFLLDEPGAHRWWPMAPCCDVEVALDEPATSWSGSGYLDTNDGDQPLAEGFRQWTWCRANLSSGAAILYDVEHRDGGKRNLSLRFAPDGSRQEISPPVAAGLPPTRLWRIARQTRSDNAAARVLRTFEDTPFYARSLLEAQIAGEIVRPMHESLSLDRFLNPFVRLMLPFRMPRVVR